MIDDPLIEEVAQAMTSTPVDARLAGRVAARIAGAHKPPVMPWLLVPFAAAAVLVIAIVVAWKAETRPATPQPASRATTQDITVAAAPRPASLPAVARNIPPPAPEPAIEPMEIDPIAIQPLVETKAAQITPIAIDRIEISPMP